MTLKEENLQILNDLEKMAKSKKDYSAQSFSQEYVHYVKKIITSIKDEYQPEMFLIAQDIIILEWGSLHCPFYLEWTIKPNYEFKIYMSVYFDDIQTKRRDSFTQIIPINRINDVLAVSLNHPGWIEYYEKYLNCS